MSKISKVPRFLEEAAKAMAGTSRVESRDMLAMQVLALIPQGAAVFCAEQTEMEKIIAPLLQNRVADYRKATVTVEQASGAIAETGSIVCTSEAAKSLQASLLPSHHIAVVASDMIFTDLDAFFASWSSEPPTHITLITGPSRTADIELNLVVGVHGPEKLDIVLF